MEGGLGNLLLDLFLLASFRLEQQQQQQQQQQMHACPV
jgi:hypothetical protein